MKTPLLIAAISALACNGNTPPPNSWARYEFYAPENNKITQAPEVVFMGDSITEGWVQTHPEFFADKPILGRGIGGQTTEQMLYLKKEQKMREK